jgi:multimeric flavodoxin WrbA
MEALAINGSPRGDRGVTARVLAPFLEGMREGGAGVELLRTCELDVGPCLGCWKCWTETKGACVQGDDMQDIHPKLSGADVLVLATPVFVDGMTGPLKNLLDRCVALLHPSMVVRGGRQRHPLRDPRAEGGRAVHLQGAQAAHAFEAPGTYVATLNVTDAAGLWATDTLVVHVRDAEPPQAVAGPGAAVDQHARVTLDASGSTDNVGITAYTWTFDYNGSRRTLSGVVVEFLFDEAGSFQVTLTVEDADGNTAADLTSVNVRDTTPPVVDAGGDRTIALGAEVALDAGRSRDNVGIKRFEWNVSGGAVPVGGSTFRFTAMGAFPAKLTVWDLAGNEASATVIITVKDRTPPVAAAGPDRTAIEGEAVALDGSGSTENVEVAAMFWTFEHGGKAQNVSGPALARTFDAAGTSAITLHVLDAEGNAATDGAVVTVLSMSVTWHIGPFLDGSGTAYNGTTDPYGSVELQVKRRDLVSPARVIVAKEGWKGLELTVPLDASGVPVGTLPPMAREEGAGGGMNGLVVVAVVAIAVVVALVLWRRRKG